MPFPVTTSAILFAVPPPIDPLKVDEPPGNIRRVNTEATFPLLMILPEPLSEANCWFQPFKSTVVPAATVSGAAGGRRLLPAPRSAFGPAACKAFNVAGESAAFQMRTSS